MSIHVRRVEFFVFMFQPPTGVDPTGIDWGDRPLKSYESNLVHHNFVQFSIV